MKLKFTTRLSILAILVAISTNEAFAVPALPGTFQITQSDGTVLTLQVFGDEFQHYTRTTDGYSVAQGTDGDYYFATAVGSAMKPTNVKAKPISRLNATERSQISGSRNAIPAIKSEMFNAASQMLMSPPRVGANGEVSPSRAANELGGGWGGEKKGEMKAIVILVNFSDVKFTINNPKAAFSSMLNDEGYSANSATGSAADYFKSNSSNQFIPEFDVYGPYDLPMTMAEYGQDDLNNENENGPLMVAQACQLADNDVDFTQYSDGTHIKNVFVYYAGNNQAEGGPANSVWPHRWSVNSGNVPTGTKREFDGRILYSYACTSELRGTGTQMAGIGTFCHEFGHVIGLPDWYDTNYSTNGSGVGLSATSVMSSGNYNNDGRTPPAYNIMERWMLGWAEPTIITAAGNYTLTPVYNNTGYLINTPTTNEYFLFENRCSGVGNTWDNTLISLRGCNGMLVYHVDQSDSYQYNWSGNRINAYAEHECMQVVRAKTTYDYAHSSWPFPGTGNVTSITDTTTPNLMSWDNASTGLSVNNIAKSGNNITFTIGTKVSGIALNKTTLSLIHHSSETLTATLSPTGSSGVIAWSSNNAAVATVTNGTVSAVGVGTAVITASSGGFEAKCTVTVSAKLAESISLNKTSIVDLPIESTETLVATVTPTDATNTPTWASADESIATVNNGVVKAISAGTTTITASIDGKNATCSVKVKDIAVTQLTVTPATATLHPRDTKQLSVAILPEEAQHRTVSWTSSNDAVASVSESGFVTALKAGKATVTAKVDDVESTCEITVTNVAVERVTVSNHSLTLWKNDSSAIEATVKPDNATDNVVLWRSTNKAVATVENGIITGIAGGNALVIASAGGMSDTCKIEVIQAAESITLDKTSLTLYPDDETDLKATVVPENAYNKEVTWTSNKTTVVTVVDGHLKAVGLGTATIFAKVGNHQAECKVTVTARPVESVTLDNTILPLVKGGSATLVATVLPNNATDRTVTWTTSNKTIATVSNGTVSAVAVGKATITATSGTKSATCEVTVSAVPVETITLSQTELALNTKHTATLTATIMPVEARGNSTAWSSSDPQTVTVSNSGLVTALKAGSATVTASSGGKQTTCKVTVTDIEVSEITISKSSLTLWKSETSTLSATVKPDNATYPTVTWSSSNEAVATVSSSGIITAKEGGSTTITATAGGKQATCQVTVNLHVESVALSQSSATIYVKDIITLSATVLPENALNKEVVWSNSNSAVVSLDNGKITALSLGTSTITATADGQSATCRITVAPKPVTSIALDPPSLGLIVGNNTTITATVMPEDATDKTVSWRSSNSSIVTVDSNGNVKAISKGSAVITATSGNISTQCPVTVSAIPVTSVTITTKNTECFMGDGYRLSTEVLPLNAEDRNLVWKSSNESVATVDQSGNVTAVGTGSATITATNTASGKNDTSEVTVKDEISEISVNLIKFVNAEVKWTAAVDRDTWVVVWGEKGSSQTTTIETTQPIVQLPNLKESVEYTVKIGGKRTSGVWGMKSTDFKTKNIQYVEQIELDHQSLSLCIGDQATLAATTSPEDAVEVEVEWSSSNEKVATVSAEGVVTATGEGEAIIKARNLKGNVSVDCPVSVVSELADLKVEPNQYDATLRWSSPRYETWIVKWRETESDQYSTKVVGRCATNIAGLKPDTQYEVVLRGKNGESESTYTFSQTFTTAAMKSSGEQLSTFNGVEASYSVNDEIILSIKNLDYEKEQITWYVDGKKTDETLINLPIGEHTITATVISENGEEEHFIRYVTVR